MGYRYTVVANRYVYPKEVKDVELIDRAMRSTNNDFNFFYRGRLSFDMDELSDVEDMELVLYRMLKGLSLEKDVEIFFISPDGDNNYAIKLTVDGKMLKAVEERKMSPWAILKDYEDDDWVMESEDELEEEPDEDDDERNDFVSHRGRYKL